jgi:hypothetical protein
MFTDGPVVPLHVESVLSFLKSTSKKKFTREDVRNCFQPNPVTIKQDQSNGAIKALIELNLIKESEEKHLELLNSAKGKVDGKTTLLKAMDELILGGTEVEYYFALFYSYLLGLNSSGIKHGTTLSARWSMDFNRDVFENKEIPNQFNKEKYTGLMRWFVYTGLGWSDQSGLFNCNPYSRIVRSLRSVFTSKKKLDSEEFFQRLAETFPELDGGKVFLQANKAYDHGAKQCTLGLSHALIDLHLDGIIKLHCPKDSDGWSIALASPPNDGKTLVSDRISQVEIGKGVGK